MGFDKNMESIPGSAKLLLGKKCMNRMKIVGGKGMYVHAALVLLLTKYGCLEEQNGRLGGGAVEFSVSIISDRVLLHQRF